MYLLMLYSYYLNSLANFWLSYALYGKMLIRKIFNFKKMYKFNPDLFKIRCIDFILFVITLLKL